MTNNARLMAPATARNREHITKVLCRYLPSHGLVLEIASGTGEHITHFASVLGADLQFQPAILTPLPEPASTRGLNQQASAMSYRP